LNQSGACIIIHPELHIIAGPWQSDLDQSVIEHSYPYFIGIIAFVPDLFDHPFHLAIPFAFDFHQLFRPCFIIGYLPAYLPYP